MNDTATDDEFYRAPDVDAYSLPGKLLRRRSVPTPSLPGAHRAWQLVYATRTSRKAPIPASGIVIAAGPISTTDKAPILLYCPVFRGLGGAAAASQLLTRDESEPETEFISSALERGWTVAVPDGQGMGLRGLGAHPFLAGAPPRTPFSTWLVPHCGYRRCSPPKPLRGMGIRRRRSRRGMGC